MINKLKQFIKNTRKVKEPEEPEGYVTSSGDIFHIGEVVIVPANTPMTRTFDGYYYPKTVDTKVYIKYFGNGGYFTVEPIFSGMDYRVHSHYLVKLNGERNYNKNLMEFLLS